jgi:hypothetical protein
MLTIHVVNKRRRFSVSCPCKPPQQELRLQRWVTPGYTPTNHLQGEIDVSAQMSD